ncbi:MAG: magnesium transporter CorA family protein [Clostridia bacterium]
MLQIFKTVESEGVIAFEEVEAMENGTWINLFSPNKDEVIEVIESLKVPDYFIYAALDKEEGSRIETEDDYILILFDIPVVNKKEHTGLYTTIPMSIIIGKEHVITVCLEDNPIVRDFMRGRVKGFHTQFKTRFLFQLLYKTASYYLRYLRHIDRASNQIEIELHRSMKNKELIELLELEKSLVYFSTSLKSNEIILEKILKFALVKMYPDDQDLLEDVIIENKQAIEMSNIYSNILSGTMDAFASVISNNLNIVMKLLAGITIVLSVPTIVASVFGMNVIVPLANQPYGFWIVLAIILGIAGILGIIMKKKDMF